MTSMTDDPRIEAVARVVAVPVHAWSDRKRDGIPWDCEGCRELAADALAAADAVDPLRDRRILNTVRGSVLDETEGDRTETRETLLWLLTDGADGHDWGCGTIDYAKGELLTEADDS